MPNTHEHPAPGVEEVVEELDRLANIYGWHHEKCAGHSHFPSCPVVKLRRMLVTLTTHQQEKEALVREISSMEKDEEHIDPGSEAIADKFFATKHEAFLYGYNQAVGEIRAIAARHGITSDTLKS